MNLKLFSNAQLETRLKNLIQQEREVLHDILLTIKEVDTRKYFLEFGFPSLFEYLTKSMGYSAGAAQRRIDAARLLKDVPALAEKIQAGEIHLNQVSVLQKAIRQSHKEGKPVTKELKAELIEMAAGKSHQQTEQLVAQSLDLEVLIQTKQIHQADESVRLELTLTKTQFEKLQKAKELLAHSVPTGDLVTLLEYLSDKVIQQKTGISHLPKTKEFTATVEVESLAKRNPGPKIEIKNRDRYISNKIKKELFTEQNCCQYTDKRTNKKCGSRWQLQIDHVQPVWAGGTNDKSNLRLFCGAHNRQVYRKQAGIRAV